MKTVSAALKNYIEMIFSGSGGSFRSRAILIASFFSCGAQTVSV